MAFHGPRYLRSLGSGYVVMAVQIAFGLAVIPLALSYLGKSSFGLWALALQVSTWLMMIDAGMTAGISRFFIDHQHDPQSDDCAKCISTSFRLLCGQGLAMLGGAIFLGFAVPWFTHLDAVHAADFRWLMLILGIATAFSFITKINGAWLYATQRLEWVNWLTLAAVILEWIALFWMLKASWGLSALAYSRALNAFVTGAGSWLVAAKGAQFPWRKIIGPWHRDVFRQIAKFGTGIFAFTVAAQALNASQTFLVTKYLGVDHATVWATAPKLYLTGQLIVARIGDFALPGLLLLISNGAAASARKTLLGTLRTTIQLAAVGGALAVALNPAFLTAWTGGRISWSLTSDILMALCLVTFLVVKTITDVVVHSKHLGRLPWVFAIESIAFLTIACLLLPHYGIPGMLAASLLTSLGIRLPYVVWRIIRHLGFVRSDSIVVARDLTFALLAAASAATLARLVLAGPSGNVSWWLLAAAGIVGAIPALPTVWRLLRSHTSSTT